MTGNPQCSQCGRVFTGHHQYIHWHITGDYTCRSQRICQRYRAARDQLQKWQGDGRQDGSETAEGEVRP